MAEWADSDAFWNGIAPIIFDARRMARAPDEVAALSRLVSIAPGTRVLDLCCGTGRHAIELAARGAIVTGVDRTAAYLEAARAHAAERGVTVELVQDDMRRFRRPAAFDLVINLYNSFGYSPDAADDRVIAEHIRASLAPGGAALMELVAKEAVARTWRTHDEFERDGWRVVEERRIEPGWGAIICSFELEKGAQRRELQFRQRLYAASELKALLLAAGFESVALFGSLAGAPYDHTADRLVVRATSARSP